MSRNNAIITAESLLEEDRDLDVILTELSPYLSDYRLLRNIANEYHVFLEVEKARRSVLHKGEKSGIISALYTLLNRKKQGNEKECTPAKDEKVKLLGFVIYKNLMPQDYKKLRENCSEVLPTVFEMDILPAAIQILLNKKWLDASCLRFVYDREDLRNYIKGVFRQGQESAELKKHWLKHELDLCCEIKASDLNLEGVEFTFAEMAVRSKKKQGISILKEYTRNRAVEVCSEEQLKQIHKDLGLDGNESVFNDEEKLTVLCFLSRMRCHILWKMIPDMPGGFDTAEGIWWNLFCKLSEVDFFCLVKCCRRNPDDSIGQETYLDNWIERSSFFKNASWDEQLPQDSHDMKEFIKQRLLVPIS